MTVTALASSWGTFRLEVVRLAGFQSAEGSILGVDRLTLRWVSEEVDARVALDQSVDRIPPAGAWALTVGGSGLAVMEPRRLQDGDGKVYTVRSEGTQGPLTYATAATSEVPDLEWSFAPLAQDLDALMSLLPF